MFNRKHPYNCLDRVSLNPTSLIFLVGPSRMVRHTRKRGGAYGVSERYFGVNSSLGSSHIPSSLSTASYIRPPLVQQGGRHRRSRRQGGGGYLSTERYFGVDPSLAAAGVAPSTQANNSYIRPPLLAQKGGKRKSRRVRGGFYPSIMGSFVANAESVMPMLAGASAYKLYRSSKKQSRRSRRKGA